MAVSLGDIRRRYKALWPVLDERGRRRFAAAEASICGFGGVSMVARVTGMARSTIARGIKELEQKPKAETGRVRPARGSPAIRQLRLRGAWCAARADSGPADVAKVTRL